MVLTANCSKFVPCLAFNLWPIWLISFQGAFGQAVSSMSRSFADFKVLLHKLFYHYLTKILGGRLLFLFTDKETGPEMLSGRSASFELKSFGIRLHVLSITSLPLELWAGVGMGMEEDKEDIGKKKREQIFFFFFEMWQSWIRLLSRMFFNFKLLWC